jgi:hypothetical protein
MHDWGHLDGTTTGAAERIETHINAIPADAILRIYTHRHHEVYRDNARECA